MDARWFARRAQSFVSWPSSNSTGPAGNVAKGALRRGGGSNYPGGSERNPGGRDRGGWLEGWTSMETKHGAG